MTVVARRIRSTPFRTAGETWAAIVNILAPSAGESRRELENLSGLAASSIASECLHDAPLVVYGSGPRVRIYCLFGEAAMIGDDASEDRLAFNATEGDWEMSLPCPDQDFDWFAKAVAQRSNRIRPRRASEDVAPAAAEKPAAPAPFVVNEKGLFKP